MVVYVNNGILFSHKEEGNPAMCNNMDEREDIMVGRIRQTPKDKYHVIH